MVQTKARGRAAGLIWEQIEVLCLLWTNSFKQAFYMLL